MERWFDCAKLRLRDFILFAPFVLWAFFEEIWAPAYSGLPKTGRRIGQRSLLDAAPMSRVYTSASRSTNFELDPTANVCTSGSGYVVDYEYCTGSTTLSMAGDLFNQLDDDDEDDT